jgi:hypothetical protein
MFSPRRKERKEDQNQKYVLAKALKTQGRSKTKPTLQRRTNCTFYQDATF